MTLLEILIGVVVIGILAAFAVPAYFRFLHSAHEASVIHYLRAIHAAQQAWALHAAPPCFTGDFRELERTGLLPPGASTASRGHGLRWVGLAHAGARAKRPEKAPAKKSGGDTKGGEEAEGEPKTDPTPPEERVGATVSSVWYYRDYRLELQATAAAEPEACRYEVRVSPKDGRRDVRWFYLDQTGIVRAGQGVAGPDAPPI